MKEWIKQLESKHDLPDDALLALITKPVQNELLFTAADAVRRKHYGTAVYLRGLIEITNYCRNDCYYCGIRGSNREAQRYRLNKETILSCCETGYKLGFRTFVLQGGEDAYFTDKRLCEIISEIKERYPDSAVTLSVGEKSHASYQAYFNAGADRYLLRHETADAAHYGQLHPSGMDIKKRQACLWDLAEIGYQVGSGFLVGSPYQTAAHLLADLRFLQRLQPDMIGIGPFMPHQDTPFANQPHGDLDLCLRMLALTRLMFPYALIPATTALGSVHPQGRLRGLQSGANVVMPNLSPTDTRALYALYDHKISAGAEAAEGLALLKQEVESAGYNVNMGVGHVRR